ncbi:TetR/AcrR family transcriptional regulator [Halobacillus salinarum]|uniref:TetR/AcrR family transcriptional regulator n=1 Tax=Halobacillus salinarum TaxID=2932257 RepID=A0ABY4EGP5_9BACI|nr:TetR/AcrR family transcriptional regulator [Halobacillus salinarum]UOQ43641.1 TetR/AcrR family transcriptional regulator [Halobacillus salinarum]
MAPKVSREYLENRRADILAAARDVFIEHGYEKTTMAHVMEAAKISRGGLYQYFSNKEELYEAILEERLAEVVEETEKLLENEVSSYWDLLMQRLFGDCMKPDDRMDPLIPSTLEFFITGRSEERRREYGRKRYAYGVKLYAGVIQAGQQHGEFSKQYDGELLARSIIAFTDGLALDHAILDDKKELQLKQQSQLIVDFLQGALKVDYDS